MNKIKQFKKKSPNILTLSHAALHEPCTSEQHVKISAKKNTKHKHEIETTPYFTALWCKAFKETALNDDTPDAKQVGVIVDIFLSHYLCLVIPFRFRWSDKITGKEEPFRR